MTKTRPWLNEVAELIEAHIRAAGGEADELTCVDVEWLKGPETLRVFIDKRAGEGDLEPVEHISVDDCAVVNKILFDCPALDQKIDSPYNLEVSSLGLEPPLRLPRHFRCYLGETVKLKLSEPIAASLSYKGQLTAVTETTITIVPAPTKTKAREPGPQDAVTIPLAAIIKARAAYSYS